MPPYWEPLLLPGKFRFKSYMKKIVFLDAASIGEDVSLEPVAKLGELVTYPFTKPEDVFERVKDCDILIINKVVIGKEQIDAAKNLKLICVAATGTNNVDIAYANNKNIPVKNVVGYSTESVAQVTLSMVLSLSCWLGYYDARVKSGEYSRGNLVSDVSRVFTELSGKRYGIVGLGNIGSRVASLAKAFGMKVVYYSTSGKPHSTEYKNVSLDELMKTCDYISVHAPMNEKTRDLIKYAQLKMMKPSAFIINLGRGGIINEEDLVRALNENVIAGAGIDVYSKEPIPLSSPYLKIKDNSKVIFTPHIGWTSQEARKCLINKLSENITSEVN